MLFFVSLSKKPSLCLDLFVSMTRLIKLINNHVLLKMTQEIDYKRPIGVSLPQSIVQLIDEERGRLPAIRFHSRGIGVLSGKRGRRKMPEDSFSVEQLGIKIGELLHLKENEIIRILRDKTDTNRLLVQVVL